jgi:hypothetical protein
VLSPLQGVEDHDHDARRIAQHLVVPETKHTIAARLQPPLTFGVALLPFGVLAAVHFDHELRRQANEIESKGTDRVLAAKPEPFELSTPERGPQFALGVSGVTSEEPGFGRGHRVSVAQRSGGEITPTLPATSRGAGSEASTSPSPTSASIEIIHHFAFPSSKIDIFPMKYW